MGLQESSQAGSLRITGRDYENITAFACNPYTWSIRFERGIRTIGTGAGATPTTRRSFRGGADAIRTAGGDVLERATDQFPALAVQSVFRVAGVRSGGGDVRV